MTAGEPSLSIVVATFDGRRHVDTCLEALLAQEVPGGAEVILVDNGSRDGTAPHVRERFPSVRVLELGRNLGFAGGYNAGIRVARGRHVAIINNDTRARPGWARSLLAALENDPSAGAITSKLVFMDRPDVIQNAGNLLLSDGSGGDRGTGEPDDGRYGKREEVFGFNGAAVLLRGEALRDCGLFDESFFMYYEDTDLSWRMRLRGWRVLYEPQAVVEHAHAASSREWSAFFMFHADRNRLFMVLKDARLGFLLRSFSGLLGRSARSSDGGVRGEARPGRRRVHIRVLGSFLTHLPALLVARAMIRSRRKLPDSAIERWCVPREEWDARSA